MEFETEKKMEKEEQNKEINVIQNTIYNIDYINYIIRELEELRWEHSWMKSYEKDNKLETIGIEKNTSYKGIAQYCRCYICRPDMYQHLKHINGQIKNILNNNI
tara:strand:+ start:2416 stop:2727 length:312 start_codon:yes stop_codon:yes gene_type:complete